MRPYEVMMVLDPGLDDETVRAEVDRATEVIRSRGGVPGRVDRWGRRRLAYEIENHREGYYVVIDASAEPAVMNDLDRSLHLSDRVLRHKVMRLPDRVVGLATTRRPSPSEAPAGAAPANPAAPAASAEATAPGDTAPAAAEGSETAVPEEAESGK